MLNRSIFEPIRQHYPRVELSNFQHWHHTDPSAMQQPATRRGMWAGGEPAVGLGAHVGTRSSHGFYGACNTTTVIASYPGGPEGRQTELAANSFTTLLHEVLTARDIVRAAPSVAVHPWLSPKYAGCGGGRGLDGGITWLASGNSSNVDETTMWEENVFHLALSTASTQFLWWQPGAQRPMGLGMPLLSKVLAELDWATGLGAHATRTAAAAAAAAGDESGAGAGGETSGRNGNGGGGGDGGGCTLRPIVSAATEIEDLAPTYLLSGMSVSCPTPTPTTATTTAATTGGEEQGAETEQEETEGEELEEQGEQQEGQVGAVTREIYRFTPRCTKTVECTWWDSSALSSHYPPKNGTRAAGWRIGSGLSIEPVPGGVVLVADAPVSTAGAWIVVEK